MSFAAIKIVIAKTLEISPRDQSKFTSDDMISKHIQRVSESARGSNSDCTYFLINRMH